MPKYNVNFSDSAYDTLGDLSRQLGQTMAEVVRDALTTYWWLVQERARGNVIIVQGNGRQSEVVFPSFERIARTQATAPSGASIRRKRRPASDGRQPVEPAMQPETPTTDLQELRNR